MAESLVSASTGAMGSLLEKLGTMLSNEYKLLKDVRDDIKFLKDELEAMQAFLIRMAHVEKPDEQAKLRADAVREMSYEVEHNIDKFMILVEREPSSKSDGFMKLLNKSMKKISDIKTRHKIAKDIKNIKNQVKDNNDRYTRYNINESSRPRNKKVDPQLCAIYKDASELVGVDGPRDELVNWLRNKRSESGNQPKVGANYECRTFVSISPSLSKAPRGSP